VTIKS